MLTLIVVACLCLGLLATTQAGDFGPKQNSLAYGNRSGYYATPFGEAARDFFHGITALLGIALGFGLILCIGVPAAFVMLMLSLFFFSQYQRERRHREMLEAQFAHNRIIDYHSSQHPPY